MLDLLDELRLDVPHELFLVGLDEEELLLREHQEVRILVSRSDQLHLNEVIVRKVPLADLSQHLTDQQSIPSVILLDLLL